MLFVFASGLFLYPILGLEKIANDLVVDIKGKHEQNNQLEADIKTQHKIIVHNRDNTERYIKKCKDCFNFKCSLGKAYWQCSCISDLY